MLRPRVIPCLLIHQGALVKTFRFGASKYVGDPINAVRIFNEKGADELMVLDIDATVNNIDPNFSMISTLAAECRMPLCYGGGIKNAIQAKRIIGLGVEKIAISSAFIENPGIIPAISNEIGRQSVVVVLDVKKSASTGNYDVFIRNGQVNASIHVCEAAIEAQKLGAGEIVINSIDRDGAMSGYDISLASMVKDAINIPITILGGARRLEDMGDLVDACGIVGVSAGSLFVFKGVYKAVLINYPSMAKRDEIFLNKLE